MNHWVIYVRRSFTKATSADVSDETQEATAKALLPVGSTYEVIRDSGGHHSGRTDERAGYQELIAKVRAGTVQGIAVYDLSRLARNTRLMMNLRHELDAQNVELLVATMPTLRYDGAAGRMFFGQLCLTAEFQANVDSERMTSMLQRVYEEGGHRGHDPFGYRSARDEHGAMLHPRRLEVVPEEAAVVRRVWTELVRRSYGEIADLFNAEGVQHRQQRPWTRDAVKDIVRRGRVYLGFVVRKRGLEERPGKHAPILDDDTYRAGIAALRRRTHAGAKPKPFRVYPLRGLIECADCGSRMWGMAHVQRGTDKRYYRCPTSACEVPLVPADTAEVVVLDAISAARLPAKVIDAARENLRQRLQVPRETLHEKQRERLQTRMVNLRKQFSWGDIEEGEYRAEMEKARQALALIPDNDKLVLFDRNRKVLTDMAANIAKATPRQREDLVRLLVDRVVAIGGAVAPSGIAWSAPARPFLTAVHMAHAVNGDECWECPQGDSNP